MNEVIPDDIALFITQRIGTLAELEGLLILRQDRHKKWDARSLATRLYLTEAQTVELLGLLCGNGLAAMEAGGPPLYSYSPASPELGLLVDRLAEFYSRHIGGDPNEGRPFFYFVRFLSFLLILIAIVLKNLSREGRR